MSDEVRVERGNGVLVITLNRPEVKNAINQAVATGIDEAITAFEVDDELPVAIITGARNTFCAGMDLKEFAIGMVLPQTSRGFAGITNVPPKKPLIAAVEGYALAGGFEIVMACDLIVAATNATFGLPEVTRGLCPTAGGLLRIATRIPYHQAMEVVLTGGSFDARRAAELGLVNRLVEPGQALAAARELAAKIVANAPLAVQAAKKVMAESPGWPASERFTRQDVITDPVRVSQDAAEGARAFAEKRKPVWRRR